MEETVKQSEQTQTAKQPWHPPTIEQIDYTATEAGAAFTPIYDGPYTYTY
ncbi:MAG TPA: hypothetical protein VF824_23045 [Thermoanaerobaculia bacterium]|jgi:hypothetical protein